MRPSPPVPPHYHSGGPRATVAMEARDRNRVQGWIMWPPLPRRPQARSPRYPPPRGRGRPQLKKVDYEAQWSPRERGLGRPRTRPLSESTALNLEEFLTDGNRTLRGPGEQCDGHQMALRFPERPMGILGSCTSHSAPISSVTRGPPPRAYPLMAPSAARQSFSEQGPFGYLEWPSSAVRPRNTTLGGSWNA